MRGVGSALSTFVARNEMRKHELLEIDGHAFGIQAKPVETFVVGDP